MTGIVEYYIVGVIDSESIESSLMKGEKEGGIFHITRTFVDTVSGTRVNPRNTYNL